MSCHPLSDAEARQVVELVKPVFSGFLAEYDVNKYPPDVYLRACKEFSQPSHVVSAITIRDALLWKWGHLGKPRIPATHTRLISEVTQKWPVLAGEMSQQPEQSFLALAGAFGGKTRFITVAFLRWPESVPTASDLDKFLMMYGKALKGAPGL